MPGVVKSMIRSGLRPLLKPVWLRVAGRVRALVEPRFKDLEEKSENLQARLANQQAQFANQQAQLANQQERIASLEQDWQQHVPAFLRATSIVVSFERELAHLKNVVLANDRKSSSKKDPELISRAGSLDVGKDT